MKKIVTHNGGFHADDVFACATLSLVFEKEGVEIQRTRDPLVIKDGDIVLDVGRVYDEEKSFDHHQEGGAGVRENGIPYAAFGLIWKKFGEKLVSLEAQKYVDKILVQTVDALDNGIDIFSNPKVKVFSVSDVIGSFNPVTKEGNEDDQIYDLFFFKALEVAKQILQRVILEASDFAEAVLLFQKAFDEAEDKRLIILNEHVRKDAISSIPEVLYVVLPYHNNTWAVRTTRKSESGFESKKLLPKEWANKSAEELQKITGVPDILFCHNKLFVANTKSKEGAIAIAQLALNN